MYVHFIIELYKVTLVTVTVLMRPLLLVQVHPERLKRRLQTSPSTQGVISHH